MSARIPADKQSDVLTLRKTGLTYREICDSTGVSYGGVRSICARNAINDPDMPVLRPRGANPPSAKHNVGICPTCKCKVSLPCLACQTKPSTPTPLGVERARARFYNYQDSEPIAYDLPADCQLRLQVVRFCRRLEPGKKPGNLRKIWILEAWLDVMATS